MSDMDRTRPDMGDTQPIPQRPPAPEETRHDLPPRDGPPPGERTGRPTRFDLPERRRRPRSATPPWAMTPNPPPQEHGPRDDPAAQATARDLPSNGEGVRDDPARHATVRGLPAQVEQPPDESVRDERAPGEPTRSSQVTLRFGPGVPAQVAEVWRGGARPRRPLSRRVAGGVLTAAVAVLAALVVWWLLRGGGPAVRVTGVSVRAPATVQHCDTTARIVGTIRTNGGHGDVSYRWRRSDGQVSGVLTETLQKGQHSVRVPLRWTIKGTGTLHAVATLEIVTPATTAGRASAGFVYDCG